MKLTRAEKVRLGTFVATGLTLFIGGVLSLAGLKVWERRDIYTANFDESVSGLEVSAQVKYQGLRVGRVDAMRVNPKDPGVIEVNIHPAADWPRLVELVTAVYEEARACRLSAEKFLPNGRPVGTGGGSHIVLGGARPQDSPLLRRPDLLRSMQEMKRRNMGDSRDAQDLIWFHSDGNDISSNPIALDLLEAGKRTPAREDAEKSAGAVAVLGGSAAIGLTRTDDRRLLTGSHALKHLTVRGALTRTIPVLDPDTGLMRDKVFVLPPEAPPDDAEAIYELERCIECGCCIAACGTAQMHDEFVGAVALNKLARFRLDPRDARDDRDFYELIGTDDGVFGCMSLLACNDFCPKDLPLQSQIAFLRRKMLVAGLKGDRRDD